MKLIEAAVAAVMPLTALAQTPSLPLRPNRPRNEFDHLYLSKIVEGRGLEKAIEITNVGDINKPFSGFAVKYTDIYVTVVYNGGTATETAQLQAPPGKSDFLERDESLILCSSQARKKDVRNRLCGDSPLVDKKFDNSILKFNGNDQIIIELRQSNEPRVVQDTFGNLDGDDFTICGRERAAVNSVLTRKADSVRLSFVGKGTTDTTAQPCMWEWASVKLREFTLPPAQWNRPIDRSVLAIGDYRDGVELLPKELFLQAGDSKPVRIADMEANPNQRKVFNNLQRKITVCIKQSTFRPEVLAECNYIWDAGVEGFDSDGVPVPFDVTLSGLYEADPERLEQEFRLVDFSLNMCERSKQNPAALFFGEYTKSYLCETDADCASIDNLGGPAVCGIVGAGLGRPYPTFCYRKGWTGSPRGSQRECGISADCPYSNEYCLIQYFDESVGRCFDKSYRQKIQAKEENLVIPPGETRSLNFRVDNNDVNDVATAGRLYYVAKGNPAGLANVELKFGVFDNGLNYYWPVGSRFEPTVNVVDQVDIANACSSISSLPGDYPYYTFTYYFQPGSDETILGDYEFTFTNNNAEDFILVGGFWQLDSRGD